jgi:hypothetical protein
MCRKFLQESLERKGVTPQKLHIFNDEGVRGYFSECFPEKARCVGVKIRIKIRNGIEYFDRV